MTNVYIRDSNIFSDRYPTRANPYFDWKWDKEPADRPITVFTDSHLTEVETSASTIKIAWLMEPPVINSFIYDYVRDNYGFFDAIATYDESLLALDDRFFYCPWGTSWIASEDQQMHPKSKLISAIFSDKNWTEGHKLRHQIVSECPGSIDLFGRGYKAIDNKIQGLRDYMFQVVIENQKFNSYFTEKLIDCFVTGTVPIYWGFEKAPQFFNPKGMLFIESASDFKNILNVLSPEFYQEMLPHIVENFNRAKEYLSLEKWLWNSFIQTCQ
jgi:hypothetical protein